MKMLRSKPLKLNVLVKPKVNLGSGDPMVVLSLSSMMPSRFTSLNFRSPGHTVLFLLYFVGSVTCCHVPSSACTADCA